MLASKLFVSEACYVSVSCLDLLAKGNQETKLIRAF